uniref:Putative secreted protein n=1 Tax=Ixodes ricinus TaxID=34613 RepID=A0A6B0UCE0_IXORI
MRSVCLLICSISSHILHTLPFSPLPEHTHTQTHTHTHTHTYTSTHKRTRTRTNTHTHKHTITCERTEHEDRKAILGYCPGGLPCARGEERGG